jgi:hypothetical protein
VEPTQLILTTVITAAVTTLVTQAITGAIRAAGRRRDRSKEPAVLRRRGMQWTLANQSTSLMLDVNVNVTHPEFVAKVAAAHKAGMVPTDEPYVYEQVTSILPKNAGYISSEMHPGDSVSINWSTLSRFRQRQRFHSAELNIKTDVDDYALKVETHLGGSGH